MSNLQSKSDGAGVDTEAAAHVLGGSFIAEGPVDEDDLRSMAEHWDHG